jgi:hypothetical protein
MQAKRLPLAMSALEQGSRLMRDHWRVWDNMLTVAMQLKCVSGGGAGARRCEGNHHNHHRQ